MIFLKLSQLVTKSAGFAICSYSKREFWIDYLMNLNEISGKDSNPSVHFSVFAKADNLLIDFRFGANEWESLKK